MTDLNVKGLVAALLVILLLLAATGVSLTNGEAAVSGRADDLAIAALPVAVGTREGPNPDNVAAVTVAMSAAQDTPETQDGPTATATPPPYPAPSGEIKKYSHSTPVLHR